CLIAPCLTMAATVESNETLPAVGHKPTLEIGLRINGGANLMSTDSNGKIHLSASAPELKVGDFLEFHGIYTDVDGDIESKTYTVGNDMALVSRCPGQKENKLVTEFYKKERSKVKWSHSYTIENSEIGCKITFGKSYAESDNSQTSVSGVNYSPLPIKGNYTIDIFDINLGNVKSTLTP
ncbi:TPA: hypothetical protein ACM4E9_004407, partial [Escherichia coli]